MCAELSPCTLGLELLRKIGLYPGRKMKQERMRGDNDDLSSVEGRKGEESSR